MADAPIPPSPSPAQPVAAPRARFFSVVWLVPVAAALVGAWLAYTSYRDRGPEILLRFSTGAGIEAGKTPIKYHGVTVGLVRRVELDRPTGEVNVTARLTKEAADFAREDTLFWMVTPRISLREASGLDTLLAGQYITLRPGEGKPQYRFRALDAPPAGGVAAPGLHIVLQVEELGALTAGSPVLHRDVPVGQVTHYDPPGPGGPLRLHLNIEEPHGRLVRKGTRFWNASGLSLDADLSGVRFRMESISTVIEGGVAFDLPAGEPEGEPAASGEAFLLHPDAEAALHDGPRLTLTASSPEGLRAGMPVVWRGVQAGRVVAVRLRDSLAGAEADVLLRREARPLARAGSQYWTVRPGVPEFAREGVTSLLRGTRIEAAAGEGPATNRFACAAVAPAYRPDEPGLHVRLLCPTALQRGTAIRHRGLEVGRVQGCELDPQTGWMVAHAAITPAFAPLLTANAGFWLEDGVSLDANWNGLRARWPSLATLWEAAIGVEPRPGGKPADEGMIFPLHENRDAARIDGLPLRLRMPEARGMVAGAPVHYRGVEIGRVLGLEPALDDPERPVHARLRLDAAATAFIRSDARFWLVEPRLDLGGSSNLFAYVTGPWLEARPGEGPPAETVSLAEGEGSPLAGGVTVRLRVPRASSLDAGAPVFFLGAEAGEITSRRIGDDGASLWLEAAIRPELAAHVRAGSRFHEREGVKVSGGLRGVQIEAAPLLSLVRGGIAFFNPEGTPAVPPEADAVFLLHPSEAAAREGGRLLRVALPDARGLSRGADARHQGVAIGRVEEVRLGPDLRSAVAEVRLFDGLDAFGREGARWWVVSADISLRGVRDADTLLGGPYLNAEPGDGPDRAALTGQPAPPVAEGLDLVLRTSRAASLAPGVSVLYRDLRVGRVMAVELAPIANHVRVHIRIATPYTPLITRDSRFWNAGGFGMDVGLFGAKVRSSTLESLFSGGISLATPSAGPAPAAGTEFPLHDEPEADWLKWRPELPLASP